MEPIVSNHPKCQAQLVSLGGHLWDIGGQNTGGLLSNVYSPALNKNNW